MSIEQMFLHSLSLYIFKIFIVLIPISETYDKEWNIFIQNGNVLFQIWRVRFWQHISPYIWRQTAPAMFIHKSI